ncbi:uncharacterized protein LOC116766903 [Danaus plexippus]|uniref:Uncharacterized protein n=1 Tax=Danaus plexippus plexippus TaxID=278856 RepID=A0A212ET58_DANPL|nr:uncharacterized protein LOC116766903 [Danaus plexippus]OWR44634.1 hypothetical protein KGM_200053 [Danaus plexippus plexippus]
MKHQEVTVDYWTMVKTMFSYGALTALCWIMLRLFHTVYTMPRRFRSQQENIQHTLQELQKRFPDLNITEEDLNNAEKELEEFTKEAEIDGKKENPIDKIPEIVEPASEEVKKNI